MRRLAAVLLLAAGCAHPGPAPAGAPRSAATASGWEYMVAADHPLASRAGAGILERGGTVVDAAVATSFALAVLRPESAGIGGGGFMLVRMRGKEPVFFDYRETAPAAASLDRYLRDDGSPIPGRTVDGRWAAGVPGNVAGLAAAHARFGRRPWAELLEPAIRLAEKGVEVDAEAREAMTRLAERTAGEPGRFAEARRVFLKDGRPYEVGEVFRQPDLARTLREIAEGGAEAFYRGAPAARLSADMKKHGGPMTAADLAGYEVRVRRPLRGRFRGLEVLSSPPPSSGGACLLQILNVLDGYDPRTLDRPAYAHVLVEAMKHAFADRASFLGDADFHPEVLPDVERMISPEHAARVRAAVRPGSTASPASYGRRGLGDDSGTTHYSILDKEGSAVAATETINLSYGSLVVPEGAGFVLNNELDDFTVSTGTPNAFGLLMSERNLLGPGRRPLSSMSPTLVLRDGRPMLAVGAAGGPRIITATLQTILGIVDLGLSPAEAVAAGRLHHQWSPDYLYYEPSLPPETFRRLKEIGHALRPFPFYAGGVEAVAESGGRLTGVSDPRRDGRPAGR